MENTEHRRCPECGDAEHLYAKADAKWDRAARAWIIAEWTEDGAECTTCDWAGAMEETEFQDPGEAAAVDGLTAPLADQQARLADMQGERAEKLLAALASAIGFMENARIDLHTGAPKATALATLESGIKLAREALRALGEVKA